ncbi:MAG: GatB/YqeY domain-containing protein [Pseudomonadota bacterium]
MSEPMAEGNSALKLSIKDTIALSADEAESQFNRIEAEDGHDAAEQAVGVRLATLRLIRCAVRDRDASARTRGDCDGCPEQAVTDVLVTMSNQREISAREFEESGRAADAERERAELAVIEEFLPKPLAEAELTDAVRDVVEDLQAGSLKDLGRCMSALKKRHPGKIDSRTAGKVMRDTLG